MHAHTMYMRVHVVYMYTVCVGGVSGVSSGVPTHDYMHVHVLQPHAMNMYLYIIVHVHVLTCI